MRIAPLFKPKYLLTAACIVTAFNCTRVPSREARLPEEEPPTVQKPIDTDPLVVVDLNLKDETKSIAATPTNPVVPGKTISKPPVRKHKVYADAAKGESERKSHDLSSEAAPSLAAPSMEHRSRRLEKHSSHAGATAYCCVQIPHHPMPPVQTQDFNSESYASIVENGFHSAAQEPLSTFSIDVDNASYSNVRRMLTQGQLPPSDAVRTEEFINYFRYQYPDPEGEHPFSISMDMGTAPWNSRNKLVLIGLQGKRMDVRNLPPSNLVFLIDVSGSMNRPNKLPLLKQSLKLLVDQLRAQDKVSIVVYAGAAGLVLPATSGNNRETIVSALDNLQAGGSTAGGEGLRLAYNVAREQFLSNGNNRVILATDGDFNIGESSDGAMMRLIEEKRQTGVYLTVLGFGMGNIKDSKMEILADKGNGNYAYIDNLLEARKVLVEQMGGTLHALAKDVKLQVEFNPAKVSSYRLIGYENRKLNAEDFNDDKKDAGELGAGHNVTALYEIIPVGAQIESERPRVDPLRYGSNPGIQHEDRTVRDDRDEDEHIVKRPIENSGEWLTVKFRYKKPNENTSRLLARALRGSPREMNETSENLRFAAAVAGFGMLLRNSEHKGDMTFAQIATMAEQSRSFDPEGYRAEFLRLVNLASSLTGNTRTAERD